MKVALRRSGGFAGMTRQCALDSAALAAEDAETLKRLVDAVMASPQPSAPAHPDAFQYDVSVTDDSGATRNFRWSESTLTEPARALVEWLSRR